MTVLSAPVRPVLVGRVGWVDAVRGAAILLMVLDHVLVQVDADSVLRVGSPISVTRLSFPLFMLAAAQVFRASVPWAYGRLKLLGVGLVEWVLLWALGMQLPGVVLVIFGVFVLLDLVSMIVDGRLTAIYWLGVLGLVQALYVPLPWSGYQPGLALVWFCLGRLVTGSVWPAWADAPWLRWVGRYPLSWYVGHLVAILFVLSIVETYS